MDARQFGKVECLLFLLYVVYALLLLQQQFAKMGDSSFEKFHKCVFLCAFLPFF